MQRPKIRILLVDDDANALESTRKILELAQYEVVVAVDGQAALDLARPALEAGVISGAKPDRLRFDLVVTDVRMPRLGGLEFLRALSLCGDSVPVILMTAFGRVQDAVWAMKLGAVDFLTKPFKRQQLLTSVEAALRRSRPFPQTEAARPATADGPAIGSLSGHSPEIQSARDMIRRVAPTAATVLICGESGTGKELAARSVHELSARASMPFIALNCAAVPENLIESELFGYEKGAFTGATSSRSGLFEAAHGGTLLLDEIGDMPVSLQAKLLRVLQEGEVRRVGSTSSKKIDVRLIAATHRDLRSLVSQGKFREDLLYRLEVVQIQMPSLRARASDLEELTYLFLRQFSAKHSKPMSLVAEDAMKILLAHSWPGNIRELSNVVERAVIFARAEQLEARDLPPHLAAQPSTTSQAGAASMISVPLGTSLKDVEDLLIRKTLEATSGDKNMTAKLLGINSRTIYRKLAENKETENKE